VFRPACTSDMSALDVGGKGGGRIGGGRRGRVVKFQCGGGVVRRVSSGSYPCLPHGDMHF